MSYIDELREEAELENAKWKQTVTNKRIERMLNEIGTNDPTIKKLIEVIDKEYRKY